MKSGAKRDRKLLEVYTHENEDEHVAQETQNIQKEKTENCIHKRDKKVPQSYCGNSKREKLIIILFRFCEGFVNI